VDPERQVAEIGQRAACGLVEGGVFERQRVHVQRAAHLASDEGGHQTRIEAAAQPRRDRDVAPQMDANRFLESLPQAVRPCARGTPPRPPVGSLRLRPGLEAQRPRGVEEALPGQERAHPREGRARRDDVAEAEHRVDRGRIEPRLDETGREESFRFRSERQARRRLDPDQGLDPRAVPREQQASFALVPEGQREHAPQLVENVRTPLLVEVHDYFDVGSSAEAVAAAFERGPQLGSVVDLPVADHDHLAVLAGDGLAAAPAVDDREPPDRKPDPRAAVDSLAVRSTMPKARGHPEQHRLLGDPPRIGGRYPRNAAHQAWAGAPFSSRTICSTTARASPKTIIVLSR
jgi:hypothetical protein